MPRPLLSRLTNRELADLLAPVRKGIPTLPPLIELQKCPVCAEWLPQGSRETGQCRACEAWITPLVR